MRTRATDSGVEDGWRGARIGAEIRDRRRREATRVRAEVDIGEPGPAPVTYTFLALTILATIIEFSTFGSSPTTSELGRAGGAGIGTLATGAWWKLLSANLLHANVAHVTMNVFVILLTGRWLEHLVGRWLMVATILWAALLTNVGALFIDVPTVGIGASGVAFGIIGCAVAVDPRAKTATGVIARQLAIVNIVLTFLIPGISIGGHFGGFAAGLVVGWLGWSRTRTTEHPAGRTRRGVAILTIAAALPIMAVIAIGPRVLPDQAREPRGQLTAWLLPRYVPDAFTLGNVDQCSVLDGNPLRYTCVHDGFEEEFRFSTRDDLLQRRIAE